ncbi:hypothetical protein AVEN_156511-1 [Araneus ventricosus]|uniref:Uncharacterized protein n=1 Tax=Araneus ventricosus TaxID=182803 RepID=A0A4Y2VDQ2_ARAVE|nr:hypothetical protein AVEN_156511-1 [Araneus ventricosus]
MSLKEPQTKSQLILRPCEKVKHVETLVTTWISKEKNVCRIPPLPPSRTMWSTLLPTWREPYAREIPCPGAGIFSVPGKARSERALTKSFSSILRP